MRKIIGFSCRKENVQVQANKNEISHADKSTIIVKLIYKAAERGTDKPA